MNHILVKKIDMTVVCIDYTPIMLQSSKETVANTYPDADVQTCLTNEKDQFQREYDFGYCLFGAQTRKGIHAAEAQWIFNQRINKRADFGGTAKSTLPTSINVRDLL